MLSIQITGPDQSGKGHAIAVVAKALRDAGCIVDVQLGDSHNAKKLAQSDEQHSARLSGVQVRITEQQTSR